MFSFVRRVLRHPVRDARHVVLVEDLDRVIAEPALERLAASRRRRVGAELEHAVGRGVQRRDRRRHIAQRKPAANDATTIRRTAICLLDMSYLRSSTSA